MNKNASAPFSRRIPGMLSWLMLAAALLALGEVILIIWHGGAWEWNRFLHACNPGARLVVGAIGLAAWYALRRAGRNTAAEWGRAAARLVMLAVSLAITALAGEAAIRLYVRYAQSTQSLDRLGKAPPTLDRLKIRSSHPLSLIIQKSLYPSVVYELQPNLNCEFGRRPLRTNAEGWRGDRDYPVERSPNSVRIMGIGSSAMFGWECPQGAAFLAVLESNLNRRADGVLYETLNTAVPGYNSQLEVATLRCKGLRYKPDIVVVGWANNDFHLPFFVPQEAQWNRRDVSFLFLLLFNRQRFADVAFSGVKDRREFEKTKVPESFQAGTDTEGVRKAYRELKALGEQHGFHIYVIGLMRPEAAAICREFGFPYFSIADRIPKNQYPPEYGLHGIHPRAEGHRVLAECLETELDALGWLKPGA